MKWEMSSVYIDIRLVWSIYIYILIDLHTPSRYKPKIYSNNKNNAKVFKPEGAGQVARQ